ncbi:hypothetical protein [Nocardia sp. CNY236]|uniref:hypothetical protein n=1 Tax=Nocardia sp. CNY236 TaxID=1169152 RepID=UPI000423A959|nr:hypothetical protein [Nocardia sp. CNY236]
MSAEHRVEAEAALALAEAATAAAGTPTWADMVAINSLIGRAQVCALLDIGDRLERLEAHQDDAHGAGLDEPTGDRP